jgi:hypothetical protein
VPQQPLNDKTENKALDTEADDQEYLVERRGTWGHGDPPVVEKRPRDQLSEVTSARIVIDQQIQESRDLPESPKENQQRLEG